MKIVKPILWILVVPVAFLLFLIGFYTYEDLYSKYGWLEMGKPE